MTRSRTLPDEVLATAASMMRAIGHPLRLRILEILEQGEANVSELCEALGTSQPRISQQLARLRLEGVLETKREGNQIFYRIARPEVLGMLNCIRAMGRRGKRA